MTRSGGRGFGSPLPWLGAIVVLYLTVPVVAFFVRFIGSSKRGFHVPGLGRALWVSVSAATISLAVIALFGIPLAYVLARSSGRLASLVGLLVLLPLAVPPLMGGVLVVYLVGPHTAIGRLFGGRLTDSLAGVVLAQTFVAAPFLVVVARASFASVDRGLEEVAAALGHSPLARFWLVALPSASDGVRAGLLLAWLRAFGEYGATVLLAYHPTSLPVFTYTRFSATGLSEVQAPTAVALLVAAVAVGAGRVRLRRRGQVEPTCPAPTIVRRPERSLVSIAFDLDVRLGSFSLKAAHTAASHRLAILGPSGSGKSVSLRAIAGYLGGQAGHVSYAGEAVDAIPVESRGIGYVPQGYTLIPHLNVWRQATFGVGTDPAVASYWIDTLHLGGLADRLPSELSGGQRQRVCLAQSLARQPRLLLLDEPFSSLDAPVRAELRQELRRLQHDEGLSTVLVTHDPEEAAMLANEIIVLVDGRVAQSGSAESLHRSPASPVVARMLGIANIVDGRVAGGRLSAGGVDTGVDVELPDGSEVEWCVHPEHVGIASTRAAGIGARVTDLVSLGAAWLVQVEIGPGCLLQARSTKPPARGVGSECVVQLDSASVTVWPGVEALSPGSRSGDRGFVRAEIGRDDGGVS